jgi:hypothetical protein
MKMSSITHAVKSFIKVKDLTITTITAPNTSDILGWDIEYKGKTKEFRATHTQSLKATWEAMEKWFDKQITK